MFVYNLKRRTVWEGFQAYLTEIKGTPSLRAIYVDGSFITDKETPKDVDIVIEYPDGATRTRLKATFWYLRSRIRVADKFGIDVLDCLTNEPSPNFVEFFQLLKVEEAIKRGLSAHAKKGILRISIS